MNRLHRRHLLVAALAVSILLVLGQWAAALDPVESFEWRGADLRDAFRHVGRVFGVNIVLDQNVTGQVTMTLNQVTCEQAIQYLARSNSYNYRKNGDIYIIGKEEALKSNFDVTTTRVFRIYYAEASKIASELAVAGGKIQTDATTNSVIFTGTPLELENVQEIIKQIDIQAPQVSIEARLEEMTEDAKRDLGLKVGVSGSISWDISSIHLPDISVALQALQEQHKSRSIARPNITTLNGQEGKILVGDKVPVKISTTDDSGTKVSVQFIEVGVKLYITPRVNRDGEVTLYLKPEVSTITSTTSEGMPSISTREVETILRVRDGQTVIIGGLLRQTDLDTIYKLPLIGDLPVLGKLFQFKGKSTAPQTELVFFITPHILTPTGSPATSPATGNPLIPPETGVPSQPGQTPSQSQTPTTPPANTGSTETAPGTQTPPQGSEPPVVVVIPAEEPLETTTPTPPATETVPPVTETVQPPATTQPPSVQVSLTETAYTVRKGDTLYFIARKYGVKVETLFEANGLTKDSRLEVGKQIKIPIPKDHIYFLKPGDTLWRLSKRYGTTVAILCEINGITDSTKLSVNQAIILPCAVTDIKDDRY